VGGKGEDSNWLRVVDQIAQLIGRNGVGAAARAFATGDKQALYDFARRFPEEPTSERIWSDAEARHRTEFGGHVDEARGAAAARAARITAEASDLDARIEATVPAFEAWLADERRGVAAGPKPDPLAIVRGYIRPEERKLRDEARALSSALAQAKVIEEELEAAKAEIARLSKKLAARSTELQSPTIGILNTAEALKQPEHDPTEKVSPDRAAEPSLSPQSPQDDLEQVILDACKPFVDSSLKVKPDIEQHKLKNAQVTMNIPENDQVIALLDSTVFRSNKDGAAFGLRGIYFRNNAGKPEFLPWIELSHCEIRPVGIGSWVKLRDDLKINTYQFGEQSLVLILEAVKSRIGGRTFPE
jgi:hypothetical protein